MKEITTYGKKRRRIGKIIGALAGIAVLAALVVFGLFRVRHMLSLIHISEPTRPY